MSSSDGLRVANPDVVGRMSRGEAVPHRAPRRDRRAAAKWLERSTFVGVAARTPDRVAIGFHEVL